MMKKISPAKAIELSKKLAKQIGDSNPFYLASNCFVEKRNGEEIVFDKDVTDGKLKPLFLPKKEKNFIGQSISNATDEDIDILLKNGFKVDKEFFGHEYIYRTKDIIELRGSDFKSFRKSLKYFKENYDYQLLHDYPKEKILNFLEEWSKQKELIGNSEETKRNAKFELKANIDWLNLLNKIPHKKIFVEIDGKLAGMTIFLKLHRNLWVALMQKTSREYRGLGKFLYYLKAKEMEGIEFFTTGNPGDDFGLIASKEELRPVKKVPVYVIKNIEKQDEAIP